MFGVELTFITVLKAAALLAFAGAMLAVLWLARSHRREREQEASLDNRYRSLFQPGVSDSAGDRTAELLQELRRD